MPVELSTAVDLKLSLTDDASRGSLLVWKDPRSGLDMVGDDGKPAGVILAGRDSHQYRKAEREMRSRHLDEGKRSRSAFRTPEQVDADAIGLVVGCWLGTTGNWKYGGEDPAHIEVARKMLSEQPWAMEQADAHIGDRSRFPSASPTS